MRAGSIFPPAVRSVRLKPDHQDRWTGGCACEPDDRSLGPARPVKASLPVLGCGGTGPGFPHDAHDWLGGWPYESISPAQTERFMSKLGFRRVRAFTRRGIQLGLFGSGCDEYVYARR